MSKCAYILLISIVTLGSCKVKWDFEVEDFEPKIVVDGWIESGNVAYVCLSQTLPLNSVVDSLAFSEIPIRWAKVTVSDGQTTEVLTGRIDTDYTPPFIYRGSMMTGEPGKTYTLTVEYSGQTVTAVTTIPRPVPLSDIKVTRSADNDTLFQISAYINDDSSEKNYYKFFTRVTNKEGRFYSSFLGTIDDAIVKDSQTAIPVYKGVHFTYTTKFIPFYSIDDTVQVKFTQIPQHGFDFWNSYENEITNGQNPLFPSNTNLKSNVQGGLGIWCGYGVKMYDLIVRRDCQE